MPPGDIVANVTARFYRLSDAIKIRQKCNKYLLKNFLKGEKIKIGLPCKLSEVLSVQTARSQKRPRRVFKTGSWENCTHTMSRRRCCCQQDMLIWGNGESFFRQLMETSRYGTLKPGGKIVFMAWRGVILVCKWKMCVVCFVLNVILSVRSFLTNSFSTTPATWSSDRQGWPHRGEEGRGPRVGTRWTAETGRRQLRRSRKHWSSRGIVWVILDSLWLAKS